MSYNRSDVMRWYGCPKCGAKAGHPCVGWHGRIRRALHVQRWHKMHNVDSSATAGLYFVQPAP